MFRGTNVGKKVEEYTKYEMVKHKIPLIAYALFDEEEVFCYGHLSLQGEDDVRPNTDDATIFRVGSCSKMFTALAVMILVEHGALCVDDLVVHHLSSFNPPNPFGGRRDGGSAVTLRKLLSHTAGLTREPGVGHYFDDTQPALGDVVASVENFPLKQDPNAGVFRYSNAGFAVLGRVIELATKEDFSTFIKEAVLEPMGMSHSSFKLADLPGKLASGWMWTLDREWQAPVFDLGESPAGNLYSTILDMAQFGKFLIRGAYAGRGSVLIRAETLRSMWQPIAVHSGGSYGLGFGINQIGGWWVIGHGGSVYGYATHFVVLPTAKVGAVVCATTDAANVIVNRIADYAVKLLLFSKGLGDEPSPVRGLAEGPKDFQPCVGYYRSSLGEVVEIKLKDDQLYLVEHQVPLQLQAVGAADFLIDGRLWGPARTYADLNVRFVWRSAQARGRPLMIWRGRIWKPVSKPPSRTVPLSVLKYLGNYGPKFNPTILFYEERAPWCLTEYFFPHSLSPVDNARYTMHGLLYEDEILRLTDDGIFIGPVFLKRVMDRQTHKEKNL